MVDAKLQTLLTVIDTQSFTKAAQKLALSQPAVSHHMRLLEEEFGVRIFFKDKKELKLTPEGEILAQYARRAVVLEANAHQEIADSRREIKHLNIGITPTSGENRVPQVLATYCGQHPHTHINIVTGTIKKLYEKLKDYELDLAIVEGSIPGENLTKVLLDTDYLCLIVSPEHPLAHCSSVSMGQLRGEKFILRTTQAGTRQLFENFLISRGDHIKNYNIMMEIDNVSTIKELVSLDLGVSIIGHSACKEEERNGSLKVIALENSSMMREISIVHHKDFIHTDVLEDIRQIYQGVQ